MAGFDVDAFVKELDDLTDDDRAVLRATFGKSTKLQGSVLRQAEFDRKFNELKGEIGTKQKALDDKQAEIEAEYGTLATWRDEQNGKYQTAQSERDAAKQELLAAQQALKRAVDEAGLDPEKFKVGTVTAPITDKPRDPETGKFVSPEELSKSLGSAALGIMERAAEINDIEREHVRLFGEPLPSSKALVTGLFDAAKRGVQNPTLRDVWETTFKVPEKRQELSVAQRKADDEKLVKETEARVRSDMALRGNRDLGSTEPMSPALKLAAKQSGNIPGENPGVSAATRDFLERRSTTT